MTTAPNPIRRGFNRIGLFGLVPACVVAAGAFVVGLYLFIQAPPTHTTVVRVSGQVHELPGIVSYDQLKWQYSDYGYPSYPRQSALNDALSAAALGLLLLVLGGLWWGFWAGVGWVVAGFQRDAEP